MGSSIASRRAAMMAAANASGASSGEKWPTPSSQVSVAAAKNSPIRSDQSRGNSGSCSGHSTVAGAAIRWPGRGPVRPARPRPSLRPPGTRRSRRRTRRAARTPIPGGRDLAGRLVARPGPVRPEVPQVGADRVRLAVDQLGAQLELVERLVPELLLGLRLQDPVADPGQRRRDDQRADQVRPVPRDRLGDPAADVVADQHGPGQAEFVDQRDQAPGLRHGVVLPGRVGLVLVGLAEPAQVRHDHVGYGRHRGRDGAVIGPVPRPAVQHQHGRLSCSRPGPLVGQPEPVDRCLLAHGHQYLYSWSRAAA